MNKLLKIKKIILAKSHIQKKKAYNINKGKSEPLVSLGQNPEEPKFDKYEKIQYNVFVAKRR